MALRRFRNTPIGPERDLEHIVVSSIPQFHDNWCEQTWIAGSLPVGAGVPDVLITSWEPAIRALAKVEAPASDILAYLKVVSRAKPSTIARRLRQPEKTVLERVESLAEVGILDSSRGNYFLEEKWRQILPEIVSVEVKVSNWRVAISQALRNLIFCHKSFVALPGRVAEVARLDPYINKAGIGVLAVDIEKGIKILKKPRRTRPRVWKYYYEIASALASNIENENRSVRRTNRSGASGFSRV